MAWGHIIFTNRRAATGPPQIFTRPQNPEKESNGKNPHTICCKNGVVRLSDGKLWQHDPKLFALNAIETEYRPDAVARRWAQLLDELWAADDATRDALQEFFGLALTDETRFQKGFILVGPARSGKGTIARMLRNLLGAKKLLRTKFKSNDPRVRIAKLHRQKNRRCA
jgi:putative DNA primase/helicase